MTEAELESLIENGEGSGLEFKRDDLRPEQLAKEIVALANFRGGRILVGVEDDGSITGLTRSDTERWVMDVVFGRHVHPIILPFYEEVAVAAGRRVAVVSIEAGVSKPHVVRHKGREDIYVRDYGYVDARGMGVRRKIVPLVRAYAGRDPLFEATEDCFRVTLPRLPAQMAASEPASAR